MKTTLSILLISILMGICSAETGTMKTNELSMKDINETVDNSLLNFYRQYSSFTDPGEYEYLYENLPELLPELCSLIRSQFIHPYAELPKYREQIPKERWNEMMNYPSVKSILEGLIFYDSTGLVFDRKPEDRLVLGCQQNAILLASILKYRGVPARVRAGHATYIAPGFHISHAICEVWNENENRWMLVDPSTERIDFSRDRFDFSNDAWLQMQNGQIDPDLYGIPRIYTGMVSILGKVCTDLASVLGTEYPINQYAPILDYVFNKEPLTAEQIEILDTISELMKSLDVDNLSKLQEIYNNTPDIQITKSFEPVSTNSDHSTRSKNN